jgi:hypothetical protein
MGREIMRKKVTIPVIIVLLISCGMFFYHQNSGSDYKNASAEDIMASINSIENTETKEKILDFISFPAYGVGSSSDSGDVVAKPEDNTALKESIEKLSKLSGDDLDKEIAKTIEKSIVENIDNTNIQWNRDFVEKYVKEYCPQYYDQLIDLIDKSESEDIGN